MIGAENLALRLKEKVRQVPHVLTAEEKAEQKRWSHAWSPKYDFVPTGTLTLCIDEYFSGAQVRANWSDTQDKPLEHQLEAIVKGFLVAGECARERQLQWDIVRQRREEEQKSIEEMQRRRAEEEQRLKKLEAMAEQWVRARQLEAFLDEVEQRIEAGTLTGSTGQWERLKWAREQVARLDPLNCTDGLSI